MGPLTIAVVVIAVVLVIGAAASAAFIGTWGPFGQIIGSGVSTTRQESYTGFTGVAVGNGFRFHITQGAAYLVVITADDNVINSVQVSQIGSTLSVGLQFGHSYQTTVLRVDITMPDLSQLDISGGASGSVSGLNSTLLTVTASGGSTAAMTGAAQGLTVDGSGGSQLDLSGLHVVNANVNLSGGSQGTVFVDGRLDASVSGGSRLFYLGNPTLGTIDKSGGSTVSRQ
jgi:hypothetical protein